MSFKINIKKKSFINKHDKKKVEVLKNINIEIQSNEFVCIVGPSGCGKTTLMNMIGGLIPYDNNEVEGNLDNDETFGYVFQTSRLLPWLTVKENIELVSKKDTN
ncbi:MAG: ATP-binding cassette domain-containing protein, partial [Alphaproteobacteria bacterium]